MTDDTKKEETAAAAQETEETKADEESAEDESEEESEEEDESGAQSTEKIDYEALAKEEREKREKAEKALAKKKFEASREKREAQGEEESEETEEEEEKPLTPTELRRILAQERQQTEKQLNAARADEVAKSLTGSDAEKSYVLEIFKSRTFPSYLSLDEQVREAYVIANQKKILGERDEALRALKGKEGVNKNPAAAHRDAPASTKEPKLSGADQMAIKGAGLSFNTISRRYEKKLANGSVIYRDPKTKQIVFQRKTS